MYIADYGSHRIRKVSATGIITTFAGTGSAGYSGDGGPATAALLDYPWSVASDFSGNVYIADYYNHRVRMVNTSGIITTIAGVGTPGFSGDGGPATAAQIYYPYGVAVDASGNVFISDWYNHRVRRVDASGIITTYAGNGTPGFSGDGGPATAAQIQNAWSLGTDLSGNLYITDYTNYRVRCVNSSGIINTFAGNGSWGNSGDGGPATAAQITYAYGVCSDFSGNVYISDYQNQNVRKVDPYGIINKFAGTGSWGFSGDGGPATAAQLFDPLGIASDGSGNIYIADYQNFRIRKVNGHNRKPFFTGGVSQSITVCGNSLYDSINKQLYIQDSDYFQLEVFSAIAGPVHGTVSLGGRPSTGDTVKPHGFSYTPTTGYVGLDSFKVRVFDGYDADTIMIYVNVLLAPAPLTGTAVMCLGFNSALSDVSPSGTWTSAVTSVATVGSTGGITSVSPGTTTVSYTLSTGCASTVVVTVNPLPGPVTGVFSVCQGLTTTLTDAGGGSWTSSNTTVATAGSATGIVTGVSVGSSTITYKLPTGCITTVTVTVNPLPSAITGLNNVCAGLSVTLSDATSGGTWSSSSTYTATVGSSTGVVTGVFAGPSNITYTLSSTGCIAVIPVTVNPLPAAISGVFSVCQGLTTSLTDGGGGSWSSSNASVATIGVGSGVVYGASAGTATITYALSTGCIVTSVVTVLPLPATITGPSNVCSGVTAAMSDATTGGAWSTLYPAVAGIGSSSGIVNGISGGTTTLTYTLGTGCITTKTITVDPTPGFISGVTKLCSGTTTALSDAGGGTWTSSNTSVAAVALTTGIVSGMSAGTATITYMLSTGCNITTAVTVNTSPAAITGATGLCIATTSALSCSTGGGIWSSSTTTVATISPSGVVTGVSVGMAIITYKVFTTGCFSTATVAVTGAPGPIAGNTNICIGSVTGLSDAAPGGTWTSSNTTVAPIVYGTGVASGMAVGTATITYSLGGSCKVTTTLTVGGAIPGITGTSVVCESGGTTNLTDATAGGTWTSSTTAMATVGYTSGVVTGVAAGTSTITYTVPSGCNTIKTVTVNSLPAAITGGTDVCAAGGSLTLSDLTGGGTWSSSSPGIATVGTSTGLVTGVIAGTATITYKLTSTGCAIGATITVDPLPSAITGVASVCPGYTTTLSDAGGGTWISSAPTIATIGSATGMVSGIATGTTVITYTLPTGCRITRAATVNPLPSSITGPTAVCVAANITLSDAGGGTWISGTTGVATIGLTSGIVTGGSLGITTISYTLPTGCMTTTTVSVSPSPTTILGPSALCVATTVNLSDAIAGGSWASSNTTVATVTPTTGDVSGLLPGSTTITYSLGSGCTINKVINVNPAPSPITGVTTVCAGTNSLLSDATPSGAWSSSNSAVVTVTSGGLATGIAAGTATITYSLGCIITAPFKVNQTPTPITGAPAVCQGSTITLSDGAGGGTWTSSNTAIATVSGTGDVTGIAPGTASIAYSLGAGCSVSKTINVNPTAPVTGSTNLCVGLITTLSDALGGGAWSSGSTGIATVTAGVVTGITTGTSVISYGLPTGCIMTTMVTVNPVPVAISGNPQVCIGTPSPLSDAVTGGAWTSSATTVATISGTGGIVTGVTTGTAVITYSLGFGCTVNQTITVQPVPVAITGPANVCAGSSVVFSDATPGGAWTSTDLSVATNIGGTISGVAAGTSSILYTLPTGCSATKVINVNPIPAAISGATQVCAGFTTALSDAGTGTWSSSSPSNATVGLSTGVVTGFLAGTASITYTLAGCSITSPMTVDPAPAGITGSANMCIGYTLSLSDATPGGAWSSDNISVATVASGVVSGLGAGTAGITYSLPTGCFASRKVTINALPPSITGVTTVCSGNSSLLSDLSTGGTWSSGAPGIASIGLTSGMLSGITGGTTTITYTLGAGCTVYTPVTVNTTPVAITGATVVCEGQTTALADLTPGGAWSSINTAVATVDASGTVTAVAAGTTGISYGMNGCFASTAVIVNPVPAAVAGGSMEVCSGSATVVSDPTTGGTWSSSVPSTAVIGMTSGIITGLVAGTSSIIYTLPTGCNASAVLTVDPLPAPVAGPHIVCGSLAISLSDATYGGSWTSSNPAVAVVTSGGLVNGIAGGSATIAYTLATGCKVVHAVTVNPAAQPITGVHDMCNSGDTIIVHTKDAPTGTWTSTLVGVTPAGLVTAYATGAASITYTLPTGCLTTVTLNVNPVPGKITGAATVCTSGVIALSDTTAGGIWSSDNMSVAMVVPSSGVVAGIGAGTTVIRYTLATSCSVADTITVFPTPAAITGSAQACVGAVTTLTDALPGGSWSSGVPAVASAGISTGDITGVAAGTATITYTSGAGCVATLPVTILPLPALYSVTGGGILCSGDPGVHVLLSGSATGIRYDLYNGLAIAGSRVGTGASLDFGPQTVNGSYTVLATNTATSCINNMSGNAVVTVSAKVTPDVNISASPSTTVCEGTAVTFTAAPTYGGSAPLYQWKVNGSNAGTGAATLSYTPAEGDVVIAMLTSNATCVITPVAYAFVTMSVEQPMIPEVTITASPGTQLVKGQSVTFTAEVANGGLSPLYQWMLNGAVVAGATNAKYTTAKLSHNDVVNCSVTSDGMCSATAKGDDIRVHVSTTGVAILTQADDIKVLPNPNKGAFTVSGTLADVENGTVSLELTDMIGQVVYKSAIDAVKGKIDEHIQLRNTLASGMYLLSIHSAAGNKVFHIVIEQ